MVRASLLVVLGWAACGGKAEAPSPSAPDAAQAPAYDAGGPQGVVTFEQDDGYAAGARVTAAFVTSGDALHTGCVASVAGACVLFTCSGPSEVGPLVSAGTLVFDGEPLTGFELPPDQYNVYAYGTGSGERFVAGETLSVGAAGGYVPTFAPQAVTMPSAIVLTKPSGPLISRSAPLDLAWSGGASGARVVFRAKGKVTEAQCAFDATSGAGSVPTEVIAPFDADVGTFSIAHEVDVELTAGAFDVRVVASNRSALDFTFAN